MSIETILVRSLIVLALIFLILALTFYPPQYAVPPFIFLVFFIIAHFLLPADSKKETKGLHKISIKIVIFFLAIAVTGAFVGLCLFWQRGQFWRLL